MKKNTKEHFLHILFNWLGKERKEKQLYIFYIFFQLMIMKEERKKKRLIKELRIFYIFF